MNRSCLRVFTERTALWAMVLIAPLLCSCSSLTSPKVARNSAPAVDRTYAAVPNYAAPPGNATPYFASAPPAYAAAGAVVPRGIPPTNVPMAAGPTMPYAPARPSAATPPAMATSTVSSNSSPRRFVAEYSLDRGAEAPTSASYVVGASASKKVVRQVSYDPPTLPPEAFTGAPGTMARRNCAPNACPPGNPYDSDTEPVVYPNPWKPDGLRGPWPYDEYIWDGGDRQGQVTVSPDWNLRGLDSEDTIAHYDTRDGRTLVTPSCRVPIYAPRFAAVRKVYGLEISENREHISGVEKPVRLTSQNAKLLATTTVQPQGPVLQHGIKTTVGLKERSFGVGIENTAMPYTAENGFLPHEDLLLIKRGEYDASEKVRLAARIQAAYSWSKEQAVQVTINGETAYETKGNNVANEAITYEMDGQPRLRLCKIASKSEATVGEVIDFTLRFDNVGDEKIGNVTIVDSLTTRLEYVPDSAQCSHKATFGTQSNEADSLILRWEIADPLRVGEGGIIRFKCRVR